jgi:hypothetical protein
MRQTACHSLYNHNINKEIKMELQSKQQQYHKKQSKGRRYLGRLLKKKVKRFCFVIPAASQLG